MRKEWDAAIADYTEAIRLNPQDAGAINKRVLLCVLLQQYDKAIEDYSTALHLRPTSIDAISNRAWLRETCLNSSRHMEK
jgi:tetratricopeptide (TPR) repeat protein